MKLICKLPPILFRDGPGSDIIVSINRDVHCMSITGLEK